MRFALVLAVVSTFTLAKTWQESDAVAELYGERQRRAASGDLVPSAEANGGLRVVRDTSFKPKLAGNQPPPCANGTTFCTEVEDYPKEYLSSVLPKEERIKEQFTVDKEGTDGEVERRMGPAGGDPLCRSWERTIFPKMAQNKDDEWLFIVNLDPGYVQGVHVEVCEKQNSPCELSSAFPPGYTSFCRQKYIYRKLIALNGDGKPVPDSFKLPSCCACYSRKTSAGDRTLSGNKSPISRPRG